MDTLVCQDCVQFPHRAGDKRAARHVLTVSLPRVHVDLVCPHIKIHFPYWSTVNVPVKVPRMVTGVDSGKSSGGREDACSSFWDLAFMIGMESAGGGGRGTDGNKIPSGTYNIRSVVPGRAVVTAVVRAHS